MNLFGFLFLFSSLMYTVNAADVKVVRIDTKDQHEQQHYHQQAQFQQPDMVKSDTVYHTQGTIVPIEYIGQQISGNYKGDVPGVTLINPLQEKSIAAVLQADPLLATLILSYNLHVIPKHSGFNHPQHLPVNPYVSLLLSHYGRYIPAQGHSSGIYGYAAANNYHNNLPFGSYKIYEDVDV